MKNPLLSVIVPTRNSAKFLDNCLKSIKNQSYKNIEIIVVDNNSTDKTKEIVEDLRFKTKDIRIELFNKGPERSVQRNYGAFKSKGEFVLFVDSDMELSKNIVKECVEKIGNGIGGIIIPEKSFGEGFWAKCKALEKSFYIGVYWIEAARFFPKKIFDEFKGYDEKLISGEDWDLNQRVKQVYEIARVNDCIYHSEGNSSLLSLLEKKFYYARSINKYVSKNKKEFKTQSNIISRYKLFFSNPYKLFKNPFLGIGMLFMKTSEFGVGTVGYLLKK